MLFGFFERDLSRFDWVAGDGECDVLRFVCFFFKKKAPDRPLADEFFDVSLDERVLEVFLLGLELAFSNLDFKLCTSLVREATALEVDFAISSSSSWGDTLGLKSILLAVSAVACSCKSSV